MSRKTDKLKDHIIPPPVVPSRGIAAGDQVWWWVRRAGERKSTKTFGTVQELSEEGTYARIRLAKPHRMIAVSVIEVRRLRLL